MERIRSDMEEVNPSPLKGDEVFFTSYGKTREAWLDGCLLQQGTNEWCISYATNWSLPILHMHF
jgi:hypothetical protein